MVMVLMKMTILVKLRSALAALARTQERANTFSLAVASVLGQHHCEATAFADGVAWSS